jgi:hypothetical protein
MRPLYDQVLASRRCDRKEAETMNVTHAAAILLFANAVDAGSPKLKLPDGGVSTLPPVPPPSTALPTVVASYKENGKDQYQVYHPDFGSPIAIRLGDWACQLAVASRLVKDDPNYDVASAECSADGRHFVEVQALRNMGMPNSASVSLETGDSIYAVNVEW